jgi:hypothetical protein
MKSHPGDISAAIAALKAANAAVDAANAAVEMATKAVTAAAQAAAAQNAASTNAPAPSDDPSRCKRPRPAIRMTPLVSPSLCSGHFPPGGSMVFLPSRLAGLN